MAYTPNISGLADKNPLYNTKTVVMDGITFGEFTVGNFNQGSVYQRSSSKWVNSTNTWKAVVNAVDIDWCEAALPTSGRTISSTGQLLSLVDEIFGKFSSYVPTSELSKYATTASLDAYAKKSDLSGYATTASLSSYATKTDLNSYATTTTVNNVSNKVNTLETTVNSNKTNIATLSDKVKALEDRPVASDPTAIPEANINKICV